MIHLSFQNILDGKGFSITLTGMLIVFSGLLLISIFIARLPAILAMLDRFFAAGEKKEASGAEAAAAPAKSNDPTEDEIMAAIGLVIHMELERSTGESQKITISRKQPQNLFWNSAGKMRTLSHRSPHA